jgi:hypothetical protein|tara:strand:+ start:62 stop:406 length:345 start_codon:yes stop_codon:yes gene_type:complete
MPRPSQAADAAWELSPLQAVLSPLQAVLSPLQAVLSPLQARLSPLQADCGHHRMKAETAARLATMAADASVCAAAVARLAASEALLDAPGVRWRRRVLAFGRRGRQAHAPQSGA